ncbi:hypothetical protein [Herbaspirillum autotrophicum]|uniref:hypothetical protein n=1 Tax=Herbaspirillum autotrophicum TaxID=180195 RepID=UPI00067E0AB0|nr:hypothetical protein [Herbaspirillum autotrophicum]
MNNKPPTEVTPELYRQVFEIDARGAAIFDHLVSLFSKGASTSGGIDAVLKTYLNQGENNVVQHIVRQINHANNVGVNDEISD